MLQVEKKRVSLSRSKTGRIREIAPSRKKRASLSWSKSGRKWWIAPSQKKESKLKLEQNRKNKGDCSKPEKREQA